MGSFDISACRIILRTRPSVVSRPARVTSISSVPDSFSVPAKTWSPLVFSTGSDSPVMVAWFTTASPLRTVPSAAILSPGRTRMRSPGERLCASRSSSVPSGKITCARVGVRRTSDSTARSAPRAVRRSISSAASIRNASRPAYL